MPREKKLIERFKGKPSDFTWDEFTRMMKSLGYKLMKKSGSARCFFKEGTRHKISMHEPHPSKVLKHYQINKALKRLQEFGEIER